jgi:hypothetical protein
VARHKGAAIAAAAEAAGQPPDFLGPDAALPSNPRRAGGPLMALLDGLAPAVDPLAQFWAAQSWAAQGRLTYGRLLPAGDALLTAVNRLEEAATFYQGVLDQCSRLPPIPLPAVPLGY